MRTTYSICCMLLSLMFTVLACQHNEPVNSADTELEEHAPPFAHASFRDPLSDPGRFHNEVVVAYFASRNRDRGVPLTAERFVSHITTATNEVLAARGRSASVTEKDIGVLFGFFVDMRNAGIYNVFDVDEPPSRLVAHMQAIGSLSRESANAIQFFVRHSLGAGYADPDPVLLSDATLAINNDASVQTFLAVQQASTELLSTLPLPDRVKPKGHVVAMTKQSAVAIVDAAAALTFAQFGPYATIIAGTIASTLFREAMGDEEPLPMDEWPGPCIPCP